MIVPNLAPRLWTRPVRFAALIGLQVTLLLAACETETVGPGQAEVAAIQLSPLASETRVGAAVQFQAAAVDTAGNPVPGAEIEWSTSAPSIASVSQDGRATAMGAGAATIRATSNGKEASATLTVLPLGISASRVFMVVLENRDYADVMGASDMPYLNGLANQYARATGFYANTHPSIGNYFWATVGKFVTNNDSYKDTVPDDNIFRQLAQHGKSWKVYAEDLPSVGYVGPDQGLYARRHNPATYLADVILSPSQRQNIVPLTALTTDINRGQFPQFAMIIPNDCSNGHDCPNSTTDAWLRAHIDPLVNSEEFRDGGVLIIWYDEARTNSVNGGGKIPMVFVGDGIKRGYTSAALYQHASILRLAMKTLGVTSYPNASATAPDMDEFFTP